EVRLAPGLVRERVEDRKTRRGQTHGKPRRRLRLVLDEGQRTLEEPFEVIFLARFCFQCDQQAYGDHLVLLCCSVDDSGWTHRSAGPTDPAHRGVRGCVPASSG